MEFLFLSALFYEGIRHRLKAEPMSPHLEEPVSVESGWFSFLVGFHQADQSVSGQKPFQTSLLNVFPLGRFNSFLV